MLTVLLLAVLSSASTLQHDSRPRPRGVPRVRHEAHLNTNSSQSASSCDLAQLEHRLTKLETQVSEKSEAVRWELREGVRRLQALEWQNAEVQTALQSFGNELGRPGNKPSKLEVRVDNLARGIQLAAAALKGINSDIALIKRNMSMVARDTRSMVVGQDELVTKSFLHDSLSDVKHHLQQQPPPRALLKDFPPRHCREVQERGHNVSGIYRIQPEFSPRAFMVLCDMRSKGGGWTYIQNRHEGVQNFYLNWHSYKVGFGNLGGEFWLGLEHLHHLTGYEVNELLIELIDLHSRKTYAHYAAFGVGSELEGYAIKVLGGYEGDAGDSLTYHAGSKFSTKDMDQDGWPEGNCAQAHTGAWWYKNCDMSNLNGRYLKGEVPEDLLYQGMYWAEFHGAQYSLFATRMMVRPRDESSDELFPEEN